VADGRRAGDIKHGETGGHDESGAQSGIEYGRSAQMPVGGEDRCRDRDPEDAAEALQRVRRPGGFAHIRRRDRAQCSGRRSGVVANAIETPTPAVSSGGARCA
jgi:hypothetical protein